jgi:hypothetical protein
MPKIGITKTPKTFTISISALAWLDEYCIKSNQKMSAVIDKLINEKRNQLENKKAPKYWCTSCSKDTYRELNNKEEPICVNCEAVDQAILYARKMQQP